MPWAFPTATVLVVLVVSVQGTDSRVWVDGNVPVELYCQLADEFLDGRNFQVSVQLRASHEPRCIEDQPQRFVLHHLEAVHGRLRQGTPDWGGVCGDWTDAHFVQQEFVVDGQTAVAAKKREKARNGT